MKTKTKYKFRDVVFIQGEGATEPLRILDEQGEQSATDYLSQWDCGEGEERDREPWGSSDYTFESGCYVLSYNLRLGYIGLTERLSE